MVCQAYIEGVSTRRVDDLVKSMGIDGMSKSQVSELAKLNRPGFPGGESHLPFVRIKILTSQIVTKCSAFPTGSLA